MDAPEMATAALPAPPRFLDNSQRSTAISLEWPVAYDGVEYREIVLRRLTAGEVAAFVKKIEGQPKDTGSLNWPLFYTPDGSPVPKIVLDALEDDDRFVIDKAALSFLPRRFQGMLDSDSTQTNGASTGL